MKIRIVGDPASKDGFQKATYHFVKLKHSETGMLAFEQTLLDGLFDGEDEVSLEDKTDGSFWTDHVRASSDLYPPQKPRVFPAAPASHPHGLMIGGCIVALILACSASSSVGSCGGVDHFRRHHCRLRLVHAAKPRIRPCGEAEGFKLFPVTERDRLNFTDAPVGSRTFALPPAAVAFGVRKMGKTI